METHSALLARLLGIHLSPVKSPHKYQWRGAWLFSLICAWTNGWINNRGAGDLRRHRANYDVIVMYKIDLLCWKHELCWKWQLMPQTDALRGNFISKYLLCCPKMSLIIFKIFPLNLVMCQDQSARLVRWFAYCGVISAYFTDILQATRLLLKIFVRLTTNKPSKFYNTGSVWQ